MKRMVTGVTPSGSLTLGNYLGVIKDLVAYQDTYELYIFVADLHAITTAQDPQQLRSNIQQVSALYLACGIDVDKTTLFIQSEVLEHTQMGWIMNTQSTMGELKRMTQFKDKSSKSVDKLSIPAGLFTYPCLMAGDILLYDPSYVPVGVDQKQHLELTRDLAIRMNNKYGVMHEIPEPVLTKRNIKIMDLQEPTKKMSKSTSNPKSILYLLDSPTQISNKIKAAVTDSENLIKYDPIKKPGVSNLIDIYAVLTNKTIAECEQHWEGKNYKDLKDDVTAVLIAELTPIQTHYHHILNSKTLGSTLKLGASKAQKVASRKLSKVKKKMGINVK